MKIFSVLIFSLNLIAMLQGKSAFYLMIIIIFDFESLFGLF